MTPYLWTTIPFIAFFLFILRYEWKHRRGDKMKKKVNEERYIQPILKVTAQLHEQQFGTPPKELEKAFPELRAAK